MRSQIVGVRRRHCSDPFADGGFEKLLGDQGNDPMALIAPGECRPGTKGNGTGDECKSDHGAAQGRNPSRLAHWDWPIALGLVGELSQPN
jgi:hypothetical protein